MKNHIELRAGNRLKEHLKPAAGNMLSINKLIRQCGLRHTCKRSRCVDYKDTSIVEPR